MTAGFVMVKIKNWPSPVKLRHCARFTPKKMRKYCMDSKMKRSLKTDEIREQT